MKRNNVRKDLKGLQEVRRREHEEQSGNRQLATLEAIIAVASGSQTMRSRRNAGGMSRHRSWADATSYRRMSQAKRAGLVNRRTKNCATCARALGSPVERFQWRQGTGRVCSKGPGICADRIDPRTRLVLSSRDRLSGTRPTQRFHLSNWAGRVPPACRVAEADFDVRRGLEPLTLTGTIPARCVAPDGKIDLVFATNRVVRPKEILIDDDTTHLGIAVESVFIQN
jgi:hypothetical protein